MEIWHSSGLEPYPAAVKRMEEHVAAVAKGGAQEALWFTQHPPLYTAGTSAKASDYLSTNAFPVYETGRGGEYTYHGPGQRVVYVMMDLKRRGRDVRRFVWQLEEVIITALDALGVASSRREGRVGVWVETEVGDKKIAALGIRLRRWVSFHGIAVNHSPDLSHFSGIVPCGLADYGVTSLTDLGVNVSLEDLDDALMAAFAQVFELEHVCRR